MIKDCLGLSKRYLGAAPGLDKAFAWLDEAAKNPPEDGRYEIDGERVFAIVASYTTAPRIEKILEGHYNYLDVQYLAGGGPEVIGFAAADRAPIVEDYDPTSDVVKYDPQAVESDVVLEKGYFAIFFPEDAHMPGVMYNAPAKVRKIVVKIKL
jgi:biofilm protein TabA